MYRDVLIGVGVQLNKIDECMEWAFGWGWECLNPSMGYRYWNTLHPGLFRVEGTDEVTATMTRIGKEFLKHKAKEITMEQNVAFKIIFIEGATPDGQVVFGNVGTGQLKEWLAEDSANRERFFHHLHALAKDCRLASPPFEVPKQVNITP